MRTLALLIAFGLVAIAQRHKMEEINSEKPEGKLLQQIMQENDPAKAGCSIADIAAGMYAYTNILAALITRGRTGIAVRRCQVRAIRER